MTVPNWSAAAACKEADPEEFFPPEPDVMTEVAELACAVCPVVAECLNHALAEHETHGIWGGLTPHQRVLLRRAARYRVRRQVPAVAQRAA